MYPEHPLGAMEPFFLVNSSDIQTLHAVPVHNPVSTATDTLGVCHRMGEVFNGTLSSTVAEGTTLLGGS